MKRQRGGIEMWIIGAIACAGLVAVAVGMWTSFVDGYRAEGRAEVREKYAPIIAECDKRKLASAQCVDAWLAADRDRAQAATNLTTCTTSLKDQGEKVAAATAAGEQARAATRQILAELAKRADATRAEVEKLRTLAAAPAANRKEACDETDAVLAALAARRLRVAPPAAPGAGAPGGNGQGSGTDTLRIGR